MFKDKLRSIRESKKISQTQMANMLGIAVTTYRNYENTTREPNYDILINISKILCVSTDVLLENYSPECTDNYIVQKITKLNNKSKEELLNYIDYLIYCQNQQF